MWCEKANAMCPDLVSGRATHLMGNDAARLGASCSAPATASCTAAGLATPGKGCCEPALSPLRGCSLSAVANSASRRGLEAHRLPWLDLQRHVSDTG